MRAIILLSLFAAVFANKCGENQHFDSCGTACPLTCDNYDDPPKGCVLMCNPGCHCDEGFVKTADGSCVKPKDCPARAEECGENQHFDSCGTACPVTCDNYNDPPQICVLMCNPGCHCDKGFVKTADGSCVKPKDCPARAEAECGENEHYTECGSACPKTCDNLNKPPRMCPMVCKSGCQCDHEFVRHSNGQCVRPEGCASKASAVGLCNLESETGLCRGYFPRYYFNSKSGKCEEFIYGGCGGNENNFKTIEECHNTCVEE